MSNVNRMYFKVNAFDTVIADPAKKSGRGELAVILYNGKPVLSRVIGDMRGVVVLGRPVELQRNYSNGEPLITLANVQQERGFYYSLRPFEQVLYRGLVKAEHLRNFAKYYKAETYFFERLNRTRRRKKQEGAQCL